jgi:hypothetical protein
VLGAVVVSLAGFRRLIEVQPNWIADRCTAGSLKHQTFLVLSGVGPCGGVNADVGLAERVEQVVSPQHAACSQSRRRAIARGGPTDGDVAS